MDVVSRFGEPDRVRRNGRERPRRGGQELDTGSAKEDGNVHTGLCAESADLINGGQPREGRCAPAGASPRPEAGARAGASEAHRLDLRTAQLGNEALYSIPLL